MIQGFDDCAKQANTCITGGQTVYNPWPIIGGVGISVVGHGEFKEVNKTVPGDIIILTKPIGT